MKNFKFQETPLVQNLGQGIIISNQSLVIQRVNRLQSGEPEYYLSTNLFQLDRNIRALVHREENIIKSNKLDPFQVFTPVWPIILKVMV